MTDELTVTSSLLNNVYQRMTRRAFARTAMAAGVGLAAASAVTPFSRGLDAATITDVDILNFALNLEYLEAEFYTLVTTGLTIAQVGIGVTGTGAQGPTIGGGKIALSSRGWDWRSSWPRTNRRTSTLARRARRRGGSRSRPSTSASSGCWTTRASCWSSAFLEDVGVSAYGGAAPLIADKGILGTTARILATEAEHTGAIRYYISQFGTQRPALIDAFDNNSRIISADPATALTAIRTPSQVLAIVFQNTTAGATQGALFPNRVNATINTV
jgi:hypothetical protein